MAAVKVTQFWTAFVSVVSVVFAFLRALALPKTATRTAPKTAPKTASRTPSQAPSAAVRAGQALRVVQTAQAVGGAVRERALPPTIKQRIRAEAHGASPSVRHMPTLAAPVDTPADREPAAIGALALAA
ncbi:DUF6344 domain-containing protein [Streptomyces sp. NPDC047928]|uniref:DUF6344 domain-containing protein n=1 Tax=unclassified Streptomyces TaxID=2593676 RepID=UPI00371E27E3